MVPEVSEYGRVSGRCFAARFKRERHGGRLTAVLLTAT
jgi:hypothetical protein